HRAAEEQRAAAGLVLAAVVRPAVVCPAVVCSAVVCSAVVCPAVVCPAVRTYVARLCPDRGVGPRRSGAHAGLDLEVDRNRDAVAAVRTEPLARTDYGPALAACGGPVIARRLRRVRRSGLSARPRIECDGCTAPRALRHPDRGQRAARVADEAD